MINVIVFFYITDQRITNIKLKRLTRIHLKRKKIRPNTINLKKIQVKLK